MGPLMTANIICMRDLSVFGNFAFGDLYVQV
jgi:hypothetical protein